MSKIFWIFSNCSFKLCRNYTKSIRGNSNNIRWQDNSYLYIIKYFLYRYSYRFSQSNWRTNLYQWNSLDPFLYIIRNIYSNSIFNCKLFSSCRCCWWRKHYIWWRWRWWCRRTSFNCNCNWWWWLIRNCFIPCCNWLYSNYWCWWCWWWNCC